METKTKIGYRKKPSTTLAGKKINEIDPVIAERLTLLHESLFSINIDDIRTGKVHDETLRAICGMISYKVQEDPKFKNTSGLYVAKALEDISNGLNAEKAFCLGNKNADVKSNNKTLNIAYVVWQEINFSNKKQSAIFTEAAEKFNKTEDAIRNIYYDHKMEIDNKYKSTEKCSL